MFEQLARKLYEAYRTGTPMALLRDSLPVGNIDPAYAVQQACVDLWVADGRRRVGYKVGATTEAVQAQLGLDQPLYGLLLTNFSV